MTASSLPRLLLIGHSHLYSIVGGCELIGLDAGRYAWIYVWRVEEAVQQGGEAAMIKALASRCNDVARQLLGADAEGTLAEHIREGRLGVLLALGGNEHNVIGLMNTGGSYDFLLPDETGPVRPGSTLVPFGAIRAQMERRLAYPCAMLDSLVELTEGQVVCLEAPPPIRDGDFVFANLDAFFRETYGDRVAVNPAEFRHKLWRVRCMVFQAHCVSRQVPYIAVPPEWLEEGRYLRPDAMAGDATHANARFGAAMIRSALNALDR